MIYHYQSKYEVLTLQINEDKECVKFVAGEFTTDNDETAKKIEATKSFKSGFIWKSDGVIKGANQKLRGRAGAKVHTGARGASSDAPRQ